MSALLLDWRRVLVYTHRWLGILGSLLFLAWFVSGIVLMYAGMPTLSPEERLERMVPIDLSAARMTPAEAASRQGVSPDRLRIAMLGDRPVYRFVERGLTTTVFADEGERLDSLTTDEALAAVGRWAPESTRRTCGMWPACANRTSGRFRASSFSRSTRSPSAIPATPICMCPTGRGSRS